MIIKQRE